MSHFSVLVVTDEKPTQEHLAKVLQPWHEYECTGIRDEYVVPVDVLESSKKQYETDKALSVIQRPDGTKFYAFEGGEWAKELEPFLVEGEYGRKDLKLSGDWKELKDELIKDYQTLEVWIHEYYGLPIIGANDSADDHDDGWVRFVDGVVTEAFDRTNPNKKWDWWVIGGRYQGRLASRTLGLKQDQVQVCDLAFSMMKQQASAQRRAWLNDIMLKCGYSDEDALLAAIRASQEAHAAFRALPKEEQEVNRGSNFIPWLEAHGWGHSAALGKVWDVPNILPDQTLDTWVDAALLLSCYAFVIDGTWNERGEMGWFGMASNEMSEEEWQKQIGEMLAKLKPTQWVTVVDCHI